MPVWAIRSPADAEGLTGVARVVLELDVVLHCEARDEEVARAESFDPNCDAHGFLRLHYGALNRYEPISVWWKTRDAPGHPCPNGTARYPRMRRPPGSESGPTESITTRLAPLYVGLTKPTVIESPTFTGMETSAPPTEDASGPGGTRTANQAAMPRATTNPADQGDACQRIPAKHGNPSDDTDDS
jgi:hypothetical protein